MGCLLCFICYHFVICNMADMLSFHSGDAGPSGIQVPLLRLF